MIQKIKMTLMTALSILTLAAPLAFGSIAFALEPTVPADEVNKGVCQGANLDLTNTTCDVSANGLAGGTSKINTIIKTVINIFSIVVGVIAVIMIIVGGLKYIMSGGDSGNVTGAKNTILYAIIGLVVVAMAQFVVKFVLTKVNNAPVAS